MADLIVRHLFRADYRPEQTWKLLAWCHARGADEFTVALMYFEGNPREAIDRVQSALAPWARGSQRRRVLPYRADRPDGTAEIPVWQLSEESSSVLRQHFGGSLLSYSKDPEDNGWLEDPTVWRRGELMLAVTSHENEGVLRLTHEEHREVAAAGFATRPEGKWVGY